MGEWESMDSKVSTIIIINIYIVHDSFFSGFPFKAYYSTLVLILFVFLLENDEI